MSPALRNTLLFFLFLVLAGFAGWRMFKSGGPETLPDTAESKTAWVCEKCGHVEHLTAKQVDDWRNDPKKVRMGKEFDAKRTVFWCDNCKTFTVVRAHHCPDHDVYFPKLTTEGKNGECPKCPKEAP